MLFIIGNHNIIASLQKLNTITFGCKFMYNTIIWYCDYFVRYWRWCNNKAKSLNVNDATLGNGVQEIPINHDRLCHLQLTKCRVVRISVRWNNIKFPKQTLIFCKFAQFICCGKIYVLQVPTTRNIVFEAQQHSTGCTQLSSFASPWYRVLPQAFRCSNSLSSNFMSSIGVFRHVELFMR